MSDTDTTTDPIEAEALDLDVEFEALGETWRCRGPKRINNVALLRAQRDGGPLGVYEYLLGEEQVRDLEELLDDADDSQEAFEEFDKALTDAGVSPGKSRRSSKSSKGRRRR